MESPGQDMLLFNTHPPQQRISLALTLATNRIVLEEEIREISATIYLVYLEYPVIREERLVAISDICTILRVIAISE